MFTLVVIFILYYCFILHCYENVCVYVCFACTCLHLCACVCVCICVCVFLIVDKEVGSLTFISCLLVCDPNYSDTC